VYLYLLCFVLFVLCFCIVFYVCLSFFVCTGVKLLPPSDKSISVSNDDDDDDSNNNNSNNNNNNNISLHYGHFHGVIQH
jgi:hypothetical protein